MGDKMSIFQLEDPLSERGGMSIVHRATIQYDQLYPQRNGREVAVKIARRHGDNAPDFENVLKREIRLLRRLRHPGVVRVLPINIKAGQYHGRAVELDKDKPPFYFVMELLNETQFEEVIRSNRFSLEWRIEMFYQLAQIIEYLHLYGHPHRDLKPDNILFREPPSPYKVSQPVLIDFGLAGKRRLKMDAMSVRYASPERVQRVYSGNTGMYNTKQPLSKAQKLERDKAADIWALGVILYEMLNGYYMYEENQTTAIMEAILTKRPLSMKQQITQQDPKLANYLLTSMLQPDWQQRARIHEVLDNISTNITHIAPRL